MSSFIQLVNCSMIQLIINKELIGKMVCMKWFAGMYYLKYQLHALNLFIKIIYTSFIQLKNSVAVVVVQLMDVEFNLESGCKTTHMLELKY
jgi:hypothetical protein